jgi:predicted DNA-binding protein
MKGFDDIDPPRPDQFPKPIELELSDQLSEWLSRTSAATGRSKAELIVELLDRGLQTF